MEEDATVNGIIDELAENFLGRDIADDALQQLIIGRLQFVVGSR